MKLKKAAMFGLESRVLKKQFGELFLARMQSVDSQETRGARIQSNRAAMFGLDARIALAIFGALSVISGAALYSAIQESKLVSIRVELSEMLKATEQYMLDVGEDIPFLGHNGESPSAFISSTKENWKGPYLSYDYDSSNAYKRLKHPTYTEISVQKFTDEANPSTIAPELCSSGKVCYYWALLWWPSLDLGRAFDKKYDDGVEGTGNIKVFYDTTTYPGLSVIALKGPALLTQP